jgi:hypothetical protein
MNQPQADPVTIDPDTVSKATQAGTFFHAWMEDCDQWDGWAMFTDLRTAMEITAAQYADDEYPFRNDTEDSGAAPGELTWTSDHGSWHLTDAGRDTMIRLTRTIVYGSAAQEQS